MGYVSVTDKNGRPMTDLKQEDFRVLEDGKRQSIAFFSTERNRLRIVDLLGRTQVWDDAFADLSRRAFRKFTSASLRILGRANTWQHQMDPLACVHDA